MPSQSHNRNSPSLKTLGALIAGVAVLWLAHDLLIPIALSAFIAFLLHPLQRRVERLGVRRAIAVFVVFVVALIPLLVVGWVVVSQSIHLMETLPQYEGNIQAKLQSLRGPAGGLFTRAIEMGRRLQGMMPSTETGPPAPEPMPVTIVRQTPSAVATLREYLGPFLRPLSVLGIVLVFTVFILAQWEDLRDRMIRLISGGQLTTTTSALDELTARISRFLRVQFLINSGVGVVVATGLFVIGVPNAFLWGFLAGALRYIPYVGAITAAALPLGLSIATSSGWTQPLEVLAFFVIFEVTNNNFVEPLLYGNTTGISAMALLMAAIFWAWLWGIPGLLLATPLTVCLVVAGRYVPQLSFLNVLLGDEPVLNPEEKVYQRLLAMDVEGAGEAAEEYLGEHSLVETYDKVLLPVVRSISRDREEGTIEPDREDFMYQGLRAIAEDVALQSARAQRRKELEAQGVTVPETAQPEPVAKPARLRVLSVPARDEADALAGGMLEMLAPSVEVEVRALSVDDLGTDISAIIGEYAPELVIVSAVPPHATVDARIRARQLRRKAAGLRMAVALWGLSGDATAIRERMTAAGFEAVIGSMEEAVSFLRDITPKVKEDAGQVAKEPAPGRPLGEKAA